MLWRERGDLHASRLLGLPYPLPPLLVPEGEGFVLGCAGVGRLGPLVVAYSAVNLRGKRGGSTHAY